MVKIINKSVTRGVAGKRTSSVLGVVIHNTWDNLTAVAAADRLAKMSNAQLANGFAHYYIDETTVYRTEDTYNMAWHTANTTGNSQYIGFEVRGNRSTDRKVFLQAEQNALWQAAADLRYYGLKPNRSTVRLHHEFSATECPKRSLMEHCGYDSTYAVPANTTNKLKDYFIAEITKYYNNPKLQPDGSGAGVAPKPPVTDGFNINNYITTKPAQIKVTKADYAYKEKELKNKVGGIVKAGTVLTVTDIVYSGKYPRFKLKSGLFITTRKDTVQAFKASAPKPPVPAGPKWNAKKGTFTPNTVIRVRQLSSAGQLPSTSLKEVWKFNSGESIAYDAIVQANGYEWIRQPRGTGGYWAIPIGPVKNGKRTETWGRV